MATSVDRLASAGFSLDTDDNSDWNCAICSKQSLCHSLIFLSIFFIIIIIISILWLIFLIIWYSSWCFLISKISERKKRARNSFHFSDFVVSRRRFLNIFKWLNEDRFVLNINLFSLPIIALFNLVLSNFTRRNIVFTSARSMLRRIAFFVDNIFGVLAK
jgi:hypothetical protein